MLNVRIVSTAFLLSQSAKPKQYALRNCRVEVFKFLIEKGADVDAVEYGLFDDDEVEDFMVDTPL